MLHHNLYQREPILIIFSSHSFLSILTNLITIVGVVIAFVGLIIAWMEYKNRQLEKKKQTLSEKQHAINAIKHQLLVIGEWTSYKSNGYSGDGVEWRKISFQQRADPFLMVTKIESVPLQRISLLPAVKDLGENTNEINEAIANLNQWLTNFDSLLSEIRAFKFSRNPYKNILLSKKLKNIKTIEDLEEGEERDFANQLLTYQQVLHYKIISDENGRTLHYWHKKLLKLIEELENKVKSEQKLLKK